MIEITNNGEDIAYTNYWDTEHARRGLCYLSGNAGVWRLLVPPEAEVMLTEMRTGKSATIEPSLQVPGNVDIVFDDGTDTPYFVALDRAQIDRKIEPRSDSILVVWTRRGREMTLNCKVKL